MIACQSEKDDLSLTPSSSRLKKIIEFRKFCVKVEQMKEKAREYPVTTIR